MRVQPYSGAFNPFLSGQGNMGMGGMGQQPQSPYGGLVMGGMQPQAQPQNSGGFGTYSTAPRGGIGGSVGMGGGGLRWDYGTGWGYGGGGGAGTRPRGWPSWVNDQGIDTRTGQRWEDMQARANEIRQQQQMQQQLQNQRRGIHVPPPRPRRPLYY